MLVNHSAVRAEEYSISSFPGAIRQVGIFDVTRIVNFIESAQSPKLCARIGAGAAAGVKNGDVFSLLIHDIRQCMPHVNASKDQRAKCLAGLFANLGGVV